MPKHAKHTKSERDKNMIAGLRRHAAKLDPMRVGGELPSAAAIAARYQAHLDAMADAAEKEVVWRVAVQRERKLEAEIKALHPRVQLFLHGVFGERGGELRRFGLKPFKEPEIPVDVKRRAVEKRLETRKLRRTMGKKQRRQIKGQS